VVAWVDAWRGEVYAARYVDDHIAAPAAVGLPEELLTPLAGQSLLFVGDGAVTHRASIEAVLGASAQFARSIAPPLAGTIGSLAAQVLATGARPSPHTIRPMYVRRPDAELARDARAEG
jgi:tRNA A37 threonylcarbamoyladenosine modification protein TsaB